MLDMTQTNLAEAVGITFPQIQKYERGANRVSSSRLQQFSNILNVPVDFFFEGSPKSSEDKENVVADVAKIFATSDGLSLASSFMRIKSRKTRQLIVELVDALVNER